MIFFSIGLLVLIGLCFFYRLETSAPGLSGYYWYILALCMDGLLAHYAGNFRFGVVTAICLCICNSGIATGRRQARNNTDLQTFVLILDVD